MKYDLKKLQHAYPNTFHMVSDIPEGVWRLLLPASEADLASLEVRLLTFRRREKEREEVMALQKLCGLPLRPNASLHETKVRCRIQGLVKDRLRKRRNKRRSGDSTED